MVYASWRPSCKLSWDVPRSTRSYLLQEVLQSGITPLRVSLLLRFRNFFRSLLENPSNEVQVLARLAARDIRSSVGSNLALIGQETGLDAWSASPGELRAKLLEKEQLTVPPEDEWRIPYLRKLLEQRRFAFYRGDDKETKMCQNLIDSICTN